MKSPRGGVRSGEGLGGGWSEHCQMPHGATMVMFSVIWWLARGGPAVVRLWAVMHRVHDVSGVFSNSIFLSHTTPRPSTTRLSLMSSGVWPLLR